MEGAGAAKRVKKQIHLTLAATPAHVTTTESFTKLFINHGLTKALRKAFEKRGWSTDQMQELITNFQKKHGKKVPLPKLYMDEDSSDSEGLELADGTRVGRKAAEGAGGSGGGKLGKKLLNIGYVSNETNTDVRIYTCRIYSSRDLDTLLYKLKRITLEECWFIYTRNKGLRNVRIALRSQLTSED